MAQTSDSPPPQTSHVQSDTDNVRAAPKASNAAEDTKHICSRPRPRLSKRFRHPTVGPMCSCLKTPPAVGHWSGLCWAMTAVHAPERQNLRILCPPLRHLTGPPHLHQVCGCSLGASVVAGSQDNELPGRLADMRSDRAAVSASCKNVVVTHPGPGILYQRQKVQSAASSDHPVPWYVAGSQDKIGEIVTGQTGLPQQLLRALLGLMAAAVQVVPLALLHMRPVHRCLFSLGLCRQKDLRAMLLVTRRLCMALRWWKVPGNISRGSSLGPVLRRQVISVDASLEGWGALHKGRGTSGRWGVLRQGQHISVLKLRAIHLAL